jgi:hypothetical protein
MKGAALSNKSAPLEDGRTNQDHGTPQWFIDALLEFRERIACDPCSNPWSLVPAELSYSLHRNENGLLSPWPSDGLTYINPPFGRIRPWMLKSNLQAGEYPEAEIVMVCPFTPQTKWFRLGWDGEASALACWPIRIAWDGAGDRPAFPTAIMYWGPHPGEFLLWARRHNCALFSRPSRLKRRAGVQAAKIDPRQLDLDLQAESA